MSATFYDPATPLTPREWLSIDAHERVRLVKNYLLSSKARMRDVKMSAHFLAAAENSVAEGFRPARRAVERLMSEGLSRPEAMQALASTLQAHPVHAIAGPKELSARDRQLALNAALDSLSAAGWNER